MVSKRFSFITVVIIVLVGAGVMGLANTSKTPVVQPVINVEVAPVQVMDSALKADAVGNLVATEHATISSEVDGRITKIFFKDGSDVTQGSALVQLDSAKAKADLSATQTALQLSKATYQRYLAISKEGGVSAQDLDQRRADMEAKVSDVKNAVATLKQKTLLAPFSGRLTAFKVNQGNYIKAGEAIVELVNKRVLKVDYSLPEHYLAQLHIEQPVAVTVDSFPNTVFDGKVSFISPTVDASTHTIAVSATIPNPDESLSPGMFVHIQQTIGQNKQAMMIPEEAIIAGLEGDSVFVVNNNKALLTKVTIGNREGGLAQVQHGLNAHDIVITAGQQKCVDGSTVNIVSHRAPSDTDASV